MNSPAALNISAKEKLNGLDHLRALAISMVFLFHYQLSIFKHPGWLERVAGFGWTGVDLFFVLSGFLISAQLFNQIKNGQLISLKSFFVKRFFRIVPLYLVVVLIYFLVPVFREREALPAWWRFLTFTQNFGLDLQHSGTFSHAWSLCVEEHFYLLLPLVLVLLQLTGSFKNAHRLLIFLFIMGLVIRHFIWSGYYLPNIQNDNAAVLWYKYIYYPTYNRLDGLLTGISIAAVYHFMPAMWNRISKFGNALLVGGVAILIGAGFLCKAQDSYAASVFGFPLVAIGYGCMVAGAISPVSILYKCSSKITTRIAALSYALYLIHKGIIHITQSCLADWNINLGGNMLLLVCIAMCVCGAWLLNILIEKPFMELRKKLNSKE